MLMSAKFIRGLVLAVLLPSLSIATGAFRFKEICYFTPCFFGSDSKLMELQNFSQLIVDSWFILVLISFCNLFTVDLVLGSCVLMSSRLSLRFS